MKCCRLSQKGRTALKGHEARQRGGRGEGVIGIICGPCPFPGWLVNPVPLAELLLWQEGKVHSCYRLSHNAFEGVLAGVTQPLL